MKVVVVESPAKAKTINKYLGKDYEVLASFGHIRDLPAKDGSVRPDEDFAMSWEVDTQAKKRVADIAAALKGADGLILATDPDREGEAISWHILDVLRAKKALKKDIPVQRVVFNAITKDAVTAAMANPRDIDMPLVDAYLARRALDYLVGFTLSPILWRKLPGSRSAGRVQSVALRLVSDREREIEKFRADEYWSVEAHLAQSGKNFVARLFAVDGKKTDKLDVKNGEDAAALKKLIESGQFNVANVEKKPTKRNPYAPFTTSSLQQDASSRLGLSPNRTMQIAQRLYEDGLITYMRTDAVQMAPEGIAMARSVIGKYFGAEYLPEKARIYQTKAKNAQEAHEAIRPTDCSKDRAGSGDHAKLYELIWKRALASQMASARMERTTVELEEPTGQDALRATGQVVLFPGYLALYEEGRDDEGDEDSRRLPVIRQGDTPAKKGVDAEQHFTQPPPRFSEASLVKRLEELGIGRPSTYASIIQVLKDRAYVRVEKNRFFAEETGRLLTAFLERFFEKYVNYDFTAGLEEELDDVSGGRAGWQAVLDAFWRDFQPRTAEVMERKPSEVTEALDQFLEPYLFPDKGDGTDPRLCPSCGKGRLALRGGKFGAFVACSNYPDCKFTRRFGQPGGADGGDSGPEVIGQDPETGEDISRRSGRFGPYIQRGEGKEAARASIPKDIPELDLDWAVKLLNLPRTIGNHPETGNPITASIGRYGPYLAHDGKYARLASTAEVFETGMNAAVVKLAEAAAGGGRPQRGSREPLKVMGAHPVSGAEIKLMEGRYGAYLTDGTTNATLPKTVDQATLTLDEAVVLIDAKAAAGPAKKKGGRKAPAKKAAPKKKVAAKK